MKTDTKEAKSDSKPLKAGAKKEPQANGQVLPMLSPEAWAFIDTSSPEHGVSLKDRVLLAIKDGAEHSAAALFKQLKDQIPGELIAADPQNAQAKDLKAGKRALLAATLETLKKAKRVTLKGDISEWTDEAKIELVPPAPDPRFAIDDDFKSQLPPQTPSEIAALEQLLLTEGCRDPLIVCDLDGRTLLIDGHTRLEICLRHGIRTEVKSVSLSSRQAIVDWIWSDQAGQRNLTRLAESYHRGRYFNALALQQGGDRKSKAQGEPLNAKVVGDKFSVSRATINRDAKFAKAIDAIGGACGKQGNELRGKLLSGAIQLTASKAKQLAAKDQSEIADLAKKLLNGEKIKLGTGKGKGKGKNYLRIALQRDKPEEQVETLLEGLGRNRFGKLIEVANKRLQASEKQRTAALEVAEDSDEQQA